MEGGKIPVQAFWGGQNFSAERFEGSPKGLKNTLKNFRRHHNQYNTTTFPNVPKGSSIKMYDFFYLLLKYCEKEICTPCNLTNLTTQKLSIGCHYFSQRT